MAATLAAIPFPGIISDPLINDGQPTIAGTAIMVAEVLRPGCIDLPLTTVAWKLGLTLAQVRAALDYYIATRKYRSVR